MGKFYCNKCNKNVTLKNGKCPICNTDWRNTMDELVGDVPKSNKPNYFIYIIGFVLVLTVILMIILNNTSNENNDGENYNDNYNSNSDNYNNGENKDYDYDSSELIEANGELGLYNADVKHFVCDALNEKIMFGNGSSLVTYDGEYYGIYDYNVTKKYNNEQNCRLFLKTKKQIIGFDKYTSSIIYSDFTYDSFYVMYGEKDYKEVGKLMYHEDTANRLKSKYRTKYIYQNMDLIGGNFSDDLFVDDKKIYHGVLSEDVKSYTFDDNTIDKVFPYNVVTSNGVYTYVITDTSCYDYVYGVCRHGFVLNHDLDRVKKLIAFMDKDYIVLKDGTIYGYYLYNSD